MQTLPKGVRPEDVMHPTGVLYKNPTHLQEADRASSQSDIVKEIKKQKNTVIHETFTYEDLTNIKAFPGMAKFNELDLNGLKSLFKVITKYRPNIFRIRVALGTEYSDLEQVYDNKVTNVSSNTPRNSEDIADSMAKLFEDSRLNVVDMLYQVTDTSAGHFNADAVSFSSEERFNTEYFNPIVEIEYYKNV